MNTVSALQNLAKFPSLTARASDYDIEVVPLRRASFGPHHQPSRYTVSETPTCKGTTW